jgi:hypothetical protein
MLIPNLLAILLAMYLLLALARLGATFASKRDIGLGALVSKYLPLLPYLFFALFPLYFMMVTSIKTDTELYALKAAPFWVTWAGFTVGNYQYLFDKTLYITWLGNSLKVSALATAVSVAISILAAYALARLRFRGAEERRPKDEHRTGRLANHRIGDTADVVQGPARAAIGTHRNQIAVALRGHATDLGGGGAPYDERLHRDSRLARQVLEPLLRSRLLGLLHARHRHPGQDMQQEDLGLLARGQGQGVLHRLLRRAGEIGRDEDVLELHRGFLSTQGEE